MTLLDRARELVANNPPCLVAPHEHRRVIGELADRVERLEEALRKMHDDAYAFAQMINQQAAAQRVPSIAREFVDPLGSAAAEAERAKRMEQALRDIADCVLYGREERELARAALREGGKE